MGSNVDTARGGKSAAATPRAVESARPAGGSVASRHGLTPFTKPSPALRLGAARALVSRCRY